MKPIFIALLTIIATTAIALCQQSINGTVVSAADGSPLAGASVRSTVHGTSTTTDQLGRFTLSVAMPTDTLRVTYVGYLPKDAVYAGQAGTAMEIALIQDASVLEEVVINTGYYEVPKERATGSFAHIDNELLNRSVGPDILQRLEGIAPGVQFVNAGGTSPSDIRIRGVATIESDETPLIIVDNFPYELDITTINPNDVESITVLRDAAAASIWGARAGNGVIVITTKQGRYNQKARISVNSNFTMGEKPNLYYSQNRLPGATMMEIERELFERGNYAEQPQTVIPAYVELLIKQRDGLISDADFTREEALMAQADIRDEALRHLYQGERHQQYALNIGGGGENYRYYLATGYDKNNGILMGNGAERLNINLQNTFRPLERLEVTAGIWYTQRQTASNGLGLADLAPRSAQTVSTYTRLADEQGNALPIPHERRMQYYDQASEMGLLDWHFRPLDELDYTDRDSRDIEYRLNTSIRYSFPKGFNVQATYQYVRPTGVSETYYAPESYYVRNLVNRFTQADGTQIVPYGGVLEGGLNRLTNIHSGRTQLNYSRDFGVHRVVALAGGEIRQSVGQTSPGFRIYNYDHDLLTGTANFNYTQSYPTRPTGSARISAPSVSMGHVTDRFLSYFSNAAYTYHDRYTLSGSLRWDASNLFGVKTNQKGVPLWSIGGSWEASKEAFYGVSGWLPYLRLRATYGSAGNVNKQVSVFPTVSYSSDSNTGLATARVRNVGNPSLRWEQVNTVNVAVDFALFNRRIQGNFEYYNKHASDLIGEDYMAPSTGINASSGLSNDINYANLCTQGWDVQLTTRNLAGIFSWQTDILFSQVRNRITHFNTADAPRIDNYLSNPPPIIGRSRDAIYALPWYGLDPQTGYQLMYINGETTTDYRAFYESILPDDLVVSGVTVPPYYGSMRNTLRWKGIEISANILFKAGYVFRRNSMYPGQEYFGNAGYHTDFFRRWQQPGDERSTQVPARADAYIPYADATYRNAEVLVTDGTHIRLQDVNLAYQLDGNRLAGLPVKNIRLYAYARNLGILWKANRYGIDPDYPGAEYTAPRTFALGIQLDF